MAAKKGKSKRRLIVKIKPLEEFCVYCQGKNNPDYKDHQAIAKYVSDRGKILGKARTGLCAKHQRKLAVAVKRARHLGLLPFTGGL